MHQSKRDIRISPEETEFADADFHAMAARTKAANQYTRLTGSPHSIDVIEIYLHSSSKEFFMPYVNIRITREGVTKEQKQRLVTAVTRLLQEELGKNPATTVVVIDEVDTDNWGVGGELVTERRKRGK
jgi:4-oxalocrotonate tautomerase